VATDKEQIPVKGNIKIQPEEHHSEEENEENREEKNI